ncbi:DUF2878 domain-containing protein [Thalassotalea sp. 1_MG-2023]|uniref:DUF2878 domain-containing protein n=1 Tax=Thalassotalea sp. 1_MG-2023 TaxID=3062680 RepID=UPI0026E118C6|nr:DUF2878 domain-containing protein [Thalassotalea sp. 1_MG-2023]MDO6427604.1 DUF2878 domain-containing protein [Thalassotalea sp. 1_MG-2023]
MLIHFILFNLLWLGLVIYGNAVITLALLWLVLFAWHKKLTRYEFYLAGVISFIGISIDNILTVLGIFRFPNETLIPYWLIVLWLCFSCLLLRAPLQLKTTRWLQIILAMIFAPMSYFVGFQLSAVRFGLDVILTLLLLSVIWPLFIMLAFSLENYLLQTEKDRVS